MTEKILADRYRLTEQIGMGGMAIVYRAIDLRTGHNVAVKVLRPEFNEDSEFISRFQREAEAASKMTHHNIVNLLDVGMDGENRYLVMEYVQGKTLKQVIQERGKLPAPLACQITIRILSALEHAHRNGIIHRDIKPQNILVHADGHIKVADFGIARIADSATLTKGDNVMGSVHYFSPEQARGESATAASDLYSTGIVLYEMLTGKAPFDGDNPVAIAMQHLHATPTPIQALAPDVPQAISQVCMKAMEKNPAMRYQSARDMATDLRLAMDERTERPQGTELEVRMPRPQLRDEKGMTNTGRTRAREIRNRRIRNITLTVLAGVAVVVGLFFGIQAIYRQVMTSVQVPVVTGMSLMEAQAVLDREELKYSQVYVSSEEYAANTVFLQNPTAESTTRKGDTVLLTVSTGPVSYPMPDLQRKTVSEASATLRDMGINQITVERVADAEFTLDTVVRQTPAAGEPVTRSASVVLTVSGGEAQVPDLLNMTMAEVEQTILASKLTVNTALNYIDTDDESLHGRVAAQQPEVGNRVVENYPVTLSLYRYPSERSTAVVEITAPEKQEDVGVRITLQAEQSNIVFEFSYTCTPEQPRKQTVTLDLPDYRTYICTVSFDGAQAQRLELGQSSGE